MPSLKRLHVKKEKSTDLLTTLEPSMKLVRFYPDLKKSFSVQDDYGNV